MQGSADLTRFHAELCTIWLSNFQRSSILKKYFDDVLGYSSLEGSVDNLAPRSSDCVDVKDDVEDGKVVNCSEMPTVIVSAASDSAEEGSDSCGDDCVSDAAAYRFSPVPIPDDDLPGHITRLLGKSSHFLAFFFKFFYFYSIYLILF